LRGDAPSVISPEAGIWRGRKIGHVTGKPMVGGSRGGIFGAPAFKGIEGNGGIAASGRCADGRRSASPPIHNPLYPPGIIARPPRETTSNEHVIRE